MGQRTTEEIFADLDGTLATARLGLDDFLKGPPEQRLAGLRNLTVWGRAVTNVLQNLRATESGFDDWYGPKQEEMRHDPLLRYFYELRSTLLKEGILKISTSTYIRHFDTSMLSSIPQPPGAMEFFIGDSLGGTGWIVLLPDGTKVKHYVALPTDVGT